MDLWLQIVFCVLIFLLSLSGLIVLRRQHSRTRQRLALREQVAHMSKQLQLDNLSSLRDQEFLVLFVAYVQKFRTSTATGSIRDLFLSCGVSPQEADELMHIYYDHRHPLSPILQTKLLATLS